MLKKKPRWLKWYQVRVSQKNAFRNPTLKVLLFFDPNFFYLAGKAKRFYGVVLAKNHEKSIREMCKLSYKMLISTIY
jgi:hypothetical protein